MPSAPSSRLESLPVEILTEIFVQSMNPSLPLASSSLLGLFPPTSTNQTRLGLSMISSPDHNVHSDLLRRRFLTFSLYHTLTHTLWIGCTDKTGCRFPDSYHCIPTGSGIRLYHPHGTVLPIRLVHNISEINPLTKAPWKIDLLKRLQFANVDFTIANNPQVLRDAAKGGLEEALELRNTRAIGFFCQRSWTPQTLARPTLKIIMEELHRWNGDNVEILYLLLCGWNRPYEHNWTQIKWILSRIQSDEMARGREGWELTHKDRSYLGIWLREFFISGHKYHDYVQLPKVGDKYTLEAGWIRRND
ncbi:MAG: hypothetical protein M1829_001251 [Trizodia sp. TS-e1964]|nr:MAG: hypothetical protein M1829_001251 [Trizodia sp. TS-e1964]